MTAYSAVPVHTALTQNRSRRPPLHKHILSNFPRALRLRTEKTSSWQPAASLRQFPAIEFWMLRATYYAS